MAQRMEYKTLYQAVSVERDRLLELVKVQQTRYDTDCLWMSYLTHCSVCKHSRDCSFELRLLILSLGVQNTNADLELCGSLLLTTRQTTNLSSTNCSAIGKYWGIKNTTFIYMTNA